MWSTVREERLALADLLDGLPADQWDVPSLCPAWTVKAVAIHVAPTVGGGLREFLTALLRARGNPHRASERVVAGSMGTPTRDIVADLRRNAGQRSSPPGLPPASQLADVLVHTLDIAVPLGIPVDRPAERWRAALDFLVGPAGGRGFVPPGRPRVRLVATDLDWSDGTGPEVRGPADALGTTLCGRRALLDRLEGPGVPALAQWLEE